MSWSPRQAEFWELVHQANIVLRLVKWSPPAARRLTLSVWSHWSCAYFARGPRAYRSLQIIGSNSGATPYRKYTRKYGRIVFALHFFTFNWKNIQHRSRACSNASILFFAAILYVEMVKTIMQAARPKHSEIFISFGGSFARRLGITHFWQTCIPLPPTNQWYIILYFHRFPLVFTDVDTADFIMQAITCRKCIGIPEFQWKPKRHATAFGSGYRTSARDHCPGPYWWARRSLLWTYKAPT